MKKETTEKDIYIICSGGVGFNFAFASILPELKQKYNRICVLSPYFDIFESSEFVDICYKPDELKDFLFDAMYNDAKLVCDNVYTDEDFIFKKLTFADVWRKVCNLPVNNEKYSNTKSILNPLKKFPELVASLKKVMDELSDKGFTKYVIMQFEGGQSPLVNVPKDKDGKPDWSKVPSKYNNEILKANYPYEYASEFISLFQQKHPDVGVIIYQLPNEHKFQNVINLEVPYITYYELAKQKDCIGTISIDSSLQHIVAGLTKSVVLWGHTLPESFGYSYNKNIIQKCNRNDILYIPDIGPFTAKINYIKPAEFLKEVDDYLFPEVKDE